MVLEKIGLPAKPSMRGGNWVVDASHCQGCSSQFTFINRKHHCRRCGGLFCGSCTQQRMILRGQGDSPVRICDPCKKLEDAARFEMRYGHKNRSAKGNSKQVQKQEEEILGQILSTDGKLPVLSGQELHSDMVSDILRTANSASSSSLKDDCATPGREGDTLVDSGSSSPEELRQLAVEEKKKYKILKGEGKAEDALQAFKRGKELERQAAALEIAQRKSRRMASKSTNLSNEVGTQKIEDTEALSSKKSLPSQRGKEEKGDLASELRELGWSDADLHDAERKPVKLSLEGELSNLLGDSRQEPSLGRKAGGIDNSQVIALKRKALLLKREGKLAEAKEELRRAKILEKQLEEQELLGDDEDSDDELSSLIRSMDDDKQDDLLLDHAPVPGISFDFAGIADDFVADGNFEVTDNDMNDPELAAALKSFGWAEDDEGGTNHGIISVSLDREALQDEVLTLKKEALSQKRAGNVAEAMSLLKKAKLLEKDLEAIHSDAPRSSQIFGESPESWIGDEDNITKSPPKSKLAIQKELLALKKKALTLRREGRLEEADEELRKGKVLEQQLEDIENAAKRPTGRVGKKNLEPSHRPAGEHGIPNIGEEAPEAEVTEQDMNDPALMSVLKNLGWNDDDVEPVSTTSSKVNVTIPSAMPRRSKAEIQRELLGLKRKALTLRRQGKAEEAEAELERAKDLEKQIADMEDLSSVMSRISKDEETNSVKGDENTTPPPTSSVFREAMGFDWDSSVKPGPQAAEGSANSVTILPQSESLDFFAQSGSSILHPPTEESSKKEISHVNASSENEIARRLFTPEVISAHGSDSQKDEVLARKRKAVALKREGKLAEAREELRQAKILEKTLEGGEQQTKAVNKGPSASTSVAISVAQERRPNPNPNPNPQVQKPMSGRDRFKLQQESLAHKRNALKLRREGKMQESEAEFELAKVLESQLEEFGSEGSTTSGTVAKTDRTDDAGIEDLLDPQLMSALKSIGWADNDVAVQPSKKLESKPNVEKNGNPSGGRAHLEEMIKAEKVRALNLRREGRQAEALEALRSAKKLEKRLGLLT